MNDLLSIVEEYRLFKVQRSNRYYLSKSTEVRNLEDKIVGHFGVISTISTLTVLTDVTTEEKPVVNYIVLYCIVP